MQKEILAHLLPIGVDGQKIAVGLKQGRTLLIEPEQGQTISKAAFRVAASHINTDEDWYVIKKPAIVEIENIIHIIYTVKIPLSIRLLNNAEWVSIERLSEYINDDVREIVQEGFNHGF